MLRTLGVGLGLGVRSEALGLGVGLGAQVREIAAGEMVRLTQGFTRQDIVDPPSPPDEFL